MLTDNENPILSTCSYQLNQQIDYDACIATFVYNKPTATGNSGEASVTCSPNSGSSLEKGTISVDCVARDPSGNQAMCSFEVISPGMENGLINPLSD